MAWASSAEHTTPSAPEEHAILASICAWSATGRSTPTLARAAWSMLVSTVTASRLGRGRPTARGTLLQPLAGGAHHVGAARGVDGEHVGAQAGEHARRVAHRVGDVVELEVEEHLEPTVLEITDYLATRLVEQLHADLGPHELAGHEVGKLHGALLATVKRRDDEVGRRAGVGSLLAS